MTLKDLSKELSIKLGDAVTGGDSDGEIFTSDVRLGYINRAYGKLIRVLKALMRTQAPEFTQVVDYVRYPATGYQEGTSPDKNVYAIEPFSKILDIYAFVKGDEVGGGIGLIEGRFLKELQL